jgi:hypothetical protein
MSSVTGIPVTEMMSSVDVGVLDGTTVVVGLLDGTAVVVGELDGTAVVVGLLEGTTVVVGLLDGTTVVVGLLDGTAVVVGELDGTADVVGELDGAALEGTTVCVGEFDGTNVIGELDGALTLCFDPLIPLTPFNCLLLPGNTLLSFSFLILEAETRCSVPSALTREKDSASADKARREERKRIVPSNRSNSRKVMADRPKV